MKRPYSLCQPGTAIPNPKFGVYIIYIYNKRLLYPYTERDLQKGARSSLINLPAFYSFTSHHGWEVGGARDKQSRQEKPIIENNSFCKSENTVTVMLIPGQLTLNRSEGAGCFSSKFRVLHFIHDTSVGLNGLSCKVAVRLDKVSSLANFT